MKHGRFWIFTIPMDQKKELTIGNKYYLIVRDEQMITAILQSLNGNEQSNALQAATLFNLNGTEDAKMLFSENLEESLSQTNPNMSVDNLYLSMSEWYTFFGGFLFLGVFLGSLFIMATVLIIYFKQISEGYEDCERFEIMQKVGMDKTIKLFSLTSYLNKKNIQLRLFARKFEHN